MRSVMATGDADELGVWQRVAHVPREAIDESVMAAGRLVGDQDKAAPVRKHVDPRQLCRCCLPTGKDWDGSETSAKDPAADPAEGQKFGYRSGGLPRRRATEASAGASRRLSIRCQRLSTGWRRSIRGPA